MNKKINNRLKTGVLRTGRSVIYLLCGVTSLFLLTSGYESVYSRDLPLVRTLERVTLSSFAGRYDLPGAATPRPAMYGNFGKPQNLKLPERSLRLDIVDPVRDKDNWLARSTTMHLLVPKPPRNGNIGVAMLYCRASLRTISQGTAPTVGANIFIDTDTHWRYIYRVTTARSIPEAAPYIISDNGANGRLVIVCNDAGTKTDVVVEATLLNVQGIVE